MLVYLTFPVVITQLWDTKLVLQGEYFIVHNIIFNETIFIMILNFFSPGNSLLIIFILTSTIKSSLEITCPIVWAKKTRQK